MAFNKLSPVSVPSFQEVIMQLHDINTKKLSNEQRRLQNYETEQTQQSRIAQAIAASNLAQLQSNEGQRLVSPSVDLQIAQMGATGQILPSQTAMQIAQNNMTQKAAPYLTDAQIAKANQERATADLITHNPMLGMSGDISKIGMINYLRNQAQPTGQPAMPPMVQGAQSRAGIGSNLGFDLSTPQGQADFLEKAMFAQQAKDMALGQYYNTRNQFLDFKSQPPTVQNEMIATARGYGMSPDEALAFFKNGGTLEQAKDIGRSRGINVDEAMPINAPTSTTISRDQLAVGREAELSYMAPRINAKLEPYARKFAGMSIDQIADSATGENQTRLGEYLGARALSTELAAIRNTIAGAESGIEAIKMVKEQMYGTIRDAELNMTPEAFNAMQKFIDDTIVGAFEARRKAVFKPEAQKISKGVMNSGEDPLGIR